VDGIHLNAAGYDLVARRLSLVLKERLLEAAGGKTQ
jgi:lysophospholipase L1-like esterase